MLKKFFATHLVCGPEAKTEVVTAAEDASVLEEVAGRDPFSVAEVAIEKLAYLLSSLTTVDLESMVCASCHNLVSLHTDGDVEDGSILLRTQSELFSWT